MFASNHIDIQQAIVFIAKLSTIASYRNDYQAKAGFTAKLLHMHVQVKLVSQTSLAIMTRQAKYSYMYKLIVMTSIYITA